MKFFDVNYTPRSIDRINLFDLKRIFMYKVLTNALLTDKDKSLVRQHEGDYNVHTIRKELLAYMVTSTKASVVSSIIITFVAIANFGNGT